MLLHLDQYYCTVHFNDFKMCLVNTSIKVIDSLNVDMIDSVLLFIQYKVYCNNLIFNQEWQNRRLYLPPTINSTYLQAITHAFQRSPTIYMDLIPIFSELFFTPANVYYPLPLTD